MEITFIKLAEVIKLVFHTLISYQYCEPYTVNMLPSLPYYHYPLITIKMQEIEFYRAEQIWGFIELNKYEANNMHVSYVFKDLSHYVNNLSQNKG